MDAGMPFLRPISDRYFEDYVEGDVHLFGTIAVGADEIVAFAKQFDPQTLAKQNLLPGAINPIIRKRADNRAPDLRFVCVKVARWIRAPRSRNGGRHNA